MSGRFVQQHIVYQRKLSMMEVRSDAIVKLIEVKHHLFYVDT